MALVDMDALDLPAPQGTHVASGEATMLVKSSDFDLAGRPLLIMEGTSILGEVTLRQPFQFATTRFMEFQPEHGLTEAALSESFGGMENLWGFRVRKVEQYAEPKTVAADIVEPRVIVFGPIEVQESDVAAEAPLRLGEPLLFESESDLLEGVRQAFGSPGGKRYLSSAICGMIPEHKTYVEPFIGGAAVFWKKEPSEREVINDFDFQITNAYRTIQKESPEAVLTGADKFDWMAEEGRVRKAWVATTEGIPGMMEFLYGFRSSFSGNRKNIRRSVMGVDVKPKFAWVEACHNRLEGVTILNGDWKNTIKYDSPDTLFYLDPPYPDEWARKGELEGFDIIELVERCKALKGKFLLSMSDMKAFMDALDPSWCVRKIKRITTFTKPAQMKDPTKREMDYEVLVANYPFKVDLNMRPQPEQRLAASAQLHKRGDEVWVFGPDGDDLTEGLPAVAESARAIEATELVLTGSVDDAAFVADDVLWYSQ